MPKNLGKQIFAHGRFPEVGQKQKTEGEKREEQAEFAEPHSSSTIGWSMRVACAVRGGGGMRSWPLLLPSFSLLFLFFSLFLSVFCFWPTSGNLPYVKICFPQYFGITRRYMQKNVGNFYFFTKKSLFLSVFSTLMPVFGRGRLGHPQSVEYTFSFSCKLFWEYFYYLGSRIHLGA